MNQEVTSFIQALNQSWQVEVCNQLRKMVHESITDVEERIQYKKPHFLKAGSTRRLSPLRRTPLRL
jgi:hypothetical protein